MAAKRIWFVVLLLLSGCAASTVLHHLTPAPHTQITPVTEAVFAPKLIPLNILHTPQPADAPTMASLGDDKAPVPGWYDLRPYLPTYTVQGQEGDCTAESQSDVYRVVRRVMFPYKPDFFPSRQFNYFESRWAQGTWPDDSGAYIYYAAMAGQWKGFPPESMFPYIPENLTTQPSPTVVKEALKHKYVNAHFVLPYNSPMNCALLRKAISMKRPISIGVEVFKGWYTFHGPAGGIIPMPADGEVAIGGHCPTILAYDGTGFWMKVHWNISWGNNGYGYFSDEYLNQHGFTPMSVTGVTGP